MDEQSLLNPPQARQLLGVSYDVLNNIRSNWRGLRYFRVGRTTRFYRESLEKVMKVRDGS